MNSLDVNSLCYCSSVADRLENLVDQSKCIIKDRDDFLEDLNRVESSVESINQRNSWGHYNELVIYDLWQENKHALFALKEENIVGYVQFCEKFGKPGLTICFIAVDPDAGNNGVGKNLMFAALAKIARLGYSFANLSYRGNKPNLVHFYNKIAVAGGITKVETADGSFIGGDPKKLVVYDLTDTNSL